MILDILQAIINKSYIKNQIVCSQVDKHIYSNIYIYSVGYSHVSKKIDQNTLTQGKFSRLVYLDCRGNKKIKDDIFFY